MFFPFFFVLFVDIALVLTSFFPVPQGVVSDENAYALGGIAGHAGLFSNVGDLWLLLQWLIDPEASNPLGISTETIQFFTTEYNHTQVAFFSETEIKLRTLFLFLHYLTEFESSWLGHERHQ
jgi:hypothetical protein